jgi:hypothetical protein
LHGREGERMEQVEKPEYLGTIISVNRKIDTEINNKSAKSKTNLLPNNSNTRQEEGNER